MTSWSPEQLQNAQTIISVGNQVGASQRDITIALMTAMQESGLKNINYGDAAGPDSLGLFQQRAPWGSASARMDPAEAARMFFEGGATGEPGLFSFSNRNGMSLTQAAQAVQVSAFPQAYAKWQGDAQSILGTTSTAAPTAGPTVPGSNLASVSGSSLASAGLASQQAHDQVLGESILGAPNPATDGLQQADKQASSLGSTTSVQAAQTSVLGSQKSVLAGEQTELDAAQGPNAVSPQAQAAGQQFLQPMTLADFTKTMGGTTLPGSPLAGTGVATGATGDRANIIQKAMAQVGTPYVWGGTAPGGFDCSGLVQWAYNQAGINLPRISYQQAQSGPRVAINQLQPGDLVAFDDYNRNGQGLADHISIYLGNNQILEAPHTGANVRVRTLGPADEANAWGVNMQGFFGGQTATGAGAPGSGDGIL